MKIVQVLYSLSIGGSEVLGKNLALALKQRGDIPIVCAIEGGGELEEELEKNGIESFILSRKFGEYLRPMLHLWQYFRAKKPDIVHTHHFHELFYSAIPAKLVGARLIHTEHECFSLASRKKQRLLKFLSKFCDRTTGVDTDVTAFLHDVVGIDANKLVTIRNGIDIAVFAAAGKLSRADLGLREKIPVIGIVARLEKEKDHVTLLNAFALLKKRTPAQLLIVGDGSLKEDLQRQCRELKIAEHVVFTGVRQDVPALLKLMNVFVLSSREEGLPLALLEAMAAGCAIVATNVGSIPKVIHDQQTGLLVQPGMSSELANKLQMLIQNVPYVKALGDAARSYVTHDFGHDRMLTEYLKVYRGNG